MQFSTSSRAAVGRTVLVGVVVILILLSGGAAYFLGYFGTGSKTTTPTTTTTTTSGITRDTLTIDDVFWPAGDLNQLNALGEIPYPNWLTYTVYQPMITVDPNALYNQGALNYKPALADVWTQSSDGRTYTFHLRPGVTFSDGNPVNAYQVWAEMYGFYYLSGNSSSFLESYNVFDFSNVHFGPATIQMINQTGLINPSSSVITMMQNTNWPIYVTNSSTIVFHLAAPFNFFPGTLIVYIGLIFDTQWLLDHGGWGTPAQYNTYFNQHPIPGTGPYTVTQVQENAFVKFQQNSNYWGNSLTAAQIAADPYLDPGHAKTVVVNANFDDVSRFTDLSTGKAQIAGILSQDYGQITSNPSTYGNFLFPDHSAVFVGIAMNTHRSPTNITAVRQAIVRAINYTDISQKVFFGGLSPMIGPEYPVFSQFYGLGGASPYQYNLAAAQTILTNAGIDPHNLPAMEFRVVQGCDYCNTAAQIVQSDLQQLGFKVNIIVTPSTSYAYPLTGGTESYSSALNVSQSISQLTWFGTGTFAPAADTPADSWLLFVNNQTSSNNWAIYTNPTVQKCVNGFTTISDATQLVNLCTAAYSQVYTDAPYIWLGTIKPFFGAGSLAWQKSVVSGFYVDPVFSGQSSTAVFNTVTFNS
ncbi:MAG: ABC transporter substrate-binding protein [Thaumarchaeota archaeon]|nr:ABC transporter substrate-binding protein [Nitrososphaerota archaeon]